MKRKQRKEGGKKKKREGTKRGERVDGSVEGTSVMTPFLHFNAYISP